MLNRLLHPLDQRDQALLFSSILFGGKDPEAFFNFLPDEQGQMLLQKYERLLEVPKEQRIPLIARQLKQLKSFRGTKGLEGIDPSWLLAGFKGESPRTVAIVLMHMPSSISKQITQRLPKAVRDAMPGRAELKGISLDLMKLVRSHFESKFARMPSERLKLEVLTFNGMITFRAKDLVTLTRFLGADELAVAFVAVGKRALAEFLRRLPPESAEEIISAVKRVTASEAMDVRAAQAFIGKTLGNFQSTDELFQKGGLYRLARAVHDIDPLVFRQLCQRFPRAHGRLLTEYVEKVRDRNALRDEEIMAKMQDEENEEELEPIDHPARARELRDTILEEVVGLSRKGKIDDRLGALPTDYETQ
ncbi:MAG: hypothetical protein GY822_14250 [Deltaproteobacteria bacterium]|nr:hypothetical protein [Deltaproteobacteria bacterium]